MHDSGSRRLGWLTKGKAMPNIDLEQIATDALAGSSLEEVHSTGFRPNGDAGSAERCLDAAEALDFTSADIYYDTDNDDPTTAAVQHIRVSLIQAAAEEAREIFAVLADNEDLRESVYAAVAAGNKVATPKF
jgi:hypothetical protein